jgi:hypothetical protein
MNVIDILDYEAFSTALIAQHRQTKLQPSERVLCSCWPGLEWEIAVPGISEKAHCALHGKWFSRRLGEVDGCSVKRSPDMDSNLSTMGLLKALDVERAFRLLSIEAFGLWAGPLTEKDAAFAIEWIYREKYL